MVTSWDIAREASVSQSTVSRVLNGDRRVGAETRRRVEEVIARLGYTPNAVARGLVTRRTNLVGIVVSDITNPFYPEFLAAIDKRLSERGFKMIVSNADGRSDEVNGRMLLEHRVDGIIFTSAVLDSPSVRDLVREGFPLVLTNRYVDGVDCDTVTGDNASGARAAALHLQELGHERIAVVSGVEGSSTSRDRFEAFRDALAEVGVELEPEAIRRGDYRYEKAYRETQALLALDRRPTAIFCVNDLMAFAALNAARGAGVSVPGELSVIGFDDTTLSSWETFELTTIRQPLAEMARTSVELLAQRIETPGGAPQHVSFPCLLVRRATTARPRAARGTRKPRRGDLAGGRARE